MNKYHKCFRAFLCVLILLPYSAKETLQMVMMWSHCGSITEQAMKQTGVWWSSINPSPTHCCCINDMLQKTPATYLVLPEHYSTSIVIQGNKQHRRVSCLLSKWALGSALFYWDCLVFQLFFSALPLFCFLRCITQVCTRNAVFLLIHS